MRPPPGALTAAASSSLRRRCPPSQIGPPREPTGRATRCRRLHRGSSRRRAERALLPSQGCRPGRRGRRGSRSAEQAEADRRDRGRAHPVGEPLRDGRGPEHARDVPGRRRCRRATPPRPRPTPTPGHPRDQPRISRTSRRPDQQQNHGFRGSFSATGKSDAGTQLVIHFSGHATFFDGAPRISTEHVRVTGCVTE